MNTTHEIISDQRFAVSLLSDGFPACFNPYSYRILCCMFACQISGDTIHVSNLAPDVSDDDVREIFERSHTKHAQRSRTVPIVAQSLFL